MWTFITELSRDREHLGSKMPGKTPQNILFLSRAGCDHHYLGLFREETGAPSVTTGVSGATNSSKPSTTGPFQVLPHSYEFINDDSWHLLVLWQTHTALVSLLNQFKHSPPNPKTQLTTIIDLGKCNVKSRWQLPYVFANPCHNTVTLMSQQWYNSATIMSQSMTQ